jgi:hypothetical protein
MLQRRVAPHPRCNVASGFALRSLRALQTVRQWKGGAPSPGADVGSGQARRPCENLSCVATRGTVLHGSALRHVCNKLRSVAPQTLQCSAVRCGTMRPLGLQRLVLGSTHALIKFVNECTDGCSPAAAIDANASTAFDSCHVLQRYTKHRAT